MQRSGWKGTRDHLGRRARLGGDGRFGESPDLGDILNQMRLNVGQFYGIEIEQWPVRSAEVALWLMDHQMNQELHGQTLIGLSSGPARHAFDSARSVASVANLSGSHNIRLFQR